MKTYYFGPRGGETFKVDAPNVKRAIKLFRVGALFPHQYSTGRIAEDPDAHPKVYLSSAPGAKIPVWEIDARNSRECWDKPIEEIEPDVPEAAAFSRAQLPDLGVPTPTPDDAPTQLARATALTGAGNKPRTEIERDMLQLESMTRDLERQKRELQELASGLRAELEKRMEQIWAIELFLGSKEEVVVLRQGAPAPSATRIAVRQRVLCMNDYRTLVGMCVIWADLLDIWPDSRVVFEATVVDVDRRKGALVKFDPAVVERIRNDVAERAESAAAAQTAAETNAEA